MPADPVILWFRRDLRLQDHAGVAAAVASGAPVIPLFIGDMPATRPPGDAGRWWLHRSLKVLDEELKKRRSRLTFRSGDTTGRLRDICSETGAKTIICSHLFDPKSEDFDDHLATRLRTEGIRLERYNTTLITSPNLVKTAEGRPFRVFTPFLKAMLTSGFCDSHALPGYSSADWPAPHKWPQSTRLDDLGLNHTITPSGMDWAACFDRFTPGEHGALHALRHFLAHDLADYADDRDRPDRDATSHLSPHLAFGELSPKRILHELDEAVGDDHRLASGAAKFRAELIWREFAYGLLDQQPRLHNVNFRDDFDHFPWRDDDAGFHAWCRGETGYDLVDAGMKELWRTGYMHNRVRMVCASFLTKHLLIDWRRGEQWFWDCLLDADPANNPANWQWVAGCGADAAPWFRIFNPLIQADKFDPAGLYRARYLPGFQPAVHRKRPPDLFDPPVNSRNRPQPIVDHAFARQRALDAYKERGAE